MFISRRFASLISAGLFALPAAEAFAAADPDAPPPPVDAAGGVVVPPPQQQPVAQPVPIQASVQVQPQPNEPPARRTPMFAVVPTFHLPLVGALAARGAFGGGLNVHAGYALGNLSIAFSPSLLYYSNGPSHEALLTLGAIIRYTLLREVVIHPFGEIGIDLAFPFAQSTTYPLTGRTTSLGLSAAIGAELDVSDNFSLQLGARATALVDLNITYDVLFTPFFGVVYYR